VSKTLTVILVVGIALITLGLTPLLGTSVSPLTIGSFFGGVILIVYVYLAYKEEFYIGPLYANAVRTARLAPVRDRLGRFLDEANELMKRRVLTPNDFDRWKLEFHTWSANCGQFIAERLSSADAAIFRDLSADDGGGIYDCHNTEHLNLLFNLRKHTKNLKGIIDRHLAQ
jgi:hypothetical protein